MPKFKFIGHETETDSIYTKDTPKYLMKNVSFDYDAQCDDELYIYCDVVKKWSVKTNKQKKTGEDIYENGEEEFLIEDKQPYLKLTLNDILLLHGYLGGVMKSMYEENRKSEKEVDIKLMEYYHQMNKSEY